MQRLFLKMDFLLLVLLLIASYYDIKYKIISNYISLLVLLVGFLFGKMYFSGILVAVFILLVCLFYDENYKGGGDIKLFGAIGLAKGFWYTSYLFILSELLVIVFRKVNKKLGKNMLEIPYSPFILLSMIIYIIN